MVFFTCNHCGESLKKAAVCKHYQFKSCKDKPIFLCCVDCLKDFKNDEFNEHTKCISEEARYAAKGFIQKPDKNKGAEKQATWTEALGKLLLRKDIDDYFKQILKRIADQQNVPRKKPKFVNFIKNSMRISPNNCEAIWTLISSALDDFHKLNEAKKLNNQSIADVNNCDDNKLQKESKSSKKRKLMDLENDVQQPLAKKQKNKTKHLENGITEDPCNNNVQDTLKTKKKHKKTKQEEDVIMEVMPVEQDNSSGTKKKKNKAAGKQNHNQNEEIPAVLETNNNKKSKNKVQKMTNNEKMIAARLPIDESKFSWNDEIIKVLNKSDGIQIDKLKKKVLKKFLNHSDITEPTPKILKKFSKSLKKMTNVSINNNIVKLC